MSRKGSLSYGRKFRLASFTLVELLTVIGIIAILASLVLAGATGVMKKASRSRASAEIAAISTALENYKTDNGIYPPSTGLLGPGDTVGATYSTISTDTTYKASSHILFRELSGRTNYLDNPIVGVKSYMTFKPNQLGNAKTGTGDSSSATFIADPWGYSYGYSTGDGLTVSTKYPYNGKGFFDLWSTGGVLADQGTTYATNVWVGNWNGN